MQISSDQVYDEKANTVTITVVCCSPEKIRDKLCCKGDGAIKSIEIKEPPKPKSGDKKPDKLKDHVRSTPNPEPPEKPVEKPRKVDKPKDPAPTPAPAPVAPQPVPINFCEPVHGYPRMPMYPTGICCGPCSEGYSGGPCYHGYGRSIVPPPPGPCYDGYGYGYGYRANKSCVSSDYFSEENPKGCTIT